MQFAGQKQYKDLYDQSIAAGETPEVAGKKAFLGSAHTFMAGAPAATAGTIGRFASPNQMQAPFVPSTGTMRHPVKGIDIPYAQVGRGSVRLLQDNDQALNKQKATQIVAPEVRRKNEDIERERRNQVGSKPGKKAYDLAQAEIDRIAKEKALLVQEYDRLIGGQSVMSPDAPAAKTPQSRTRIKHKETGREAWYNGPAEDVPSEYDIIGEEQ
jgi:hypothetical protein